MENVTCCRGYMPQVLGGKVFLKRILQEEVAARRYYSTHANLKQIG